MKQSFRNHIQIIRGAIFFVVFSLSSQPLSAQVTGQALLQGQTVHANIEVRFLPISIAGQADTVITDATGAFSASIVPGVYEIYFSMDGYNTLAYDNGVGQVLTGSEVLASVTLSNLFTKFVSGTIMDTLYADTMYIATGNLTVPSGQHLYMKAGTQLMFDGNYELVCNGNFDAEGTAGLPVKISSNLPNPAPESWGGIDVTAGNDTLFLNHVLIEYADIGISIVGPPVVEIQNCLFRENYFGIRMGQASGGDITNCEFADHTRSGIWTFNNFGVGITVSCNYFHGGTGGGLITNELKTDLTVTNNRFDSLMDQYDGPVAVWTSTGDVLIEDNLILNSTSGVRVLIEDSTQASFIIRHNLIAGNLIGISLRAADGGAVITMNTILNNASFGILQFFSTGGNPEEVSYNLVANNGVDYSLFQLVGAGVNILNNANGTPCDAYFNISDPGTYSPATSLYPQVGDPLIDAGDPTAGADPDGSVADIGARFDPGCPFLQSGSSVNVSNVLPGDTDTDGLANVWDFLAVGVHYGATGPSRVNASTAFIPQPAQDWGVLQSNGEDLKHVDTDGNGLINSDDSLAIILNYQPIPTGQPSTPGPGAPLTFSIPTQNVAPEDTIIIPIQLGVVDTPALGMYGMALSITYDTMMVAPGSVRLDFSDSWLGELDSSLIAIQKDHFSQGKIDFALTRNDLVNVNGYGKIADLIIVIDEDISKKDVPIALDFTDIVSQSHDGAAVGMSARGAVLNAEVQDTLSTSLSDLLDGRLLIGPNPADDILRISLSDQSRISSVRLLTMTGTLLLDELPEANQASLKTDLFPEGIYLLYIESSGGRIYQRIRISHK